MKKNNQEGKNQKVLFYTGISRAFRTTSIAHLYEISQVFPVVLLSEELDKETENILKDKTLFPKLEEVIPVSQFTGEKRNLLSENIYVHKLAKDVIKNYKPSIVILPTDICLFDFYLMRFAKKAGAINIVLNSDIRFWAAKEMSQRTDLTHTYFSLPSFLPFELRSLLIKVRKYLGYVLHNWLLPLSVGESPFLGKSSRILYSLSGFRADYRITCSKEDYNLSIGEGILPEKLVKLNHPLGRKITKRFFEKAYFLNSSQKTKNTVETLTLLLPEEPYGFKKNNHSLISETEMQKDRIKIVNLIASTLKGWRIFIKPHPATQKAKDQKNIFESVSSSVNFVNPSEPMDKYIEMSNVIVGLPPVSTVLFTTFLQRPEKPILSLDLRQEIFGDLYKDFDGIEYIDNEEKFVKILESIRDNRYHKNNETKAEPEGFSGTVEALEHLLKNKQLC